MSARKKTVSPREALWAVLWGDSKYLKLHAHKDDVLRAWNQLDAWKNTPAAEPEKLRLAEAAVKRAVKNLSDYETAFFKEHGIAL